MKLLALSALSFAGIAALGNLPLEELPTTAVLFLLWARLEVRLARLEAKVGK